MRLSGYESRKVVMIPMVIGEKIRRARQQAGFSQAELAAATGIPLNNMCSYEESTMDPEIQEQVSLSRILGVSFYYLRHNSCEDPSQHIHMQEAMFEFYDRFGPEALKRCADAISQEIERSRDGF